MSDFDAMVEAAASGLAEHEHYNPNSVDPKQWGHIRDRYEAEARAALLAAGVPALLVEVEGLRLWRGWEARAVKAEAENRRLRGDVETRARHVAAEVIRDTRERAERAEERAEGLMEVLKRHHIDVDPSPATRKERL